MSASGSGAPALAGPSDEGLGRGSAGRWGGGEGGLGLGEGAFVLGAHGGVEQSAVAQAHRGGDVPEQLHQRLQRDSGVDQGGGVGVPQRMRGDLGRPAAVGGAGELVAQRLRGDAAALVDEQELGGPAGARVRQRPAGGAPGDDPIQDDRGSRRRGAPCVRCRVCPVAPSARRRARRSGARSPARGRAAHPGAARWRG